MCAFFLLFIYNYFLFTFTAYTFLLCKVKLCSCVSIIINFIEVLQSVLFIMFSDR